MTEYEFLDYQLSIGTVVGDAAMMFITVFFAYILCAYVVGKKITIPQSIGLTFAYSAFSLLSIYGVLSNLSGFYGTATKYPEYFGETGRIYFYIVGGPLSLFSAWVISVIYMVGENQKGHRERTGKAT